MIKLHDASATGPAVISLNIDHIISVRWAKDLCPERDGSFINYECGTPFYWVTESPDDILIKIRAQRKIRASYYHE